MVYPEVEMIKFWEWDQRYALRSYLYPLFLSLPLRFLKLTDLDGPVFLNFSIQAMNSLLVSAGDLFLYKLASIHFDEQTAKLSLVMFLFHKQSILIFGSTLTNGVEGILAVIGLYYFARVFNNQERKLDMKNQRNEVYAMTTAITLAFLVRSSSLVGWIPLALVVIFSHRDNFMAMVEAGVYVTLPLIALSILVDSYFYGRMTFP